MSLLPFQQKQPWWLIGSVPEKSVRFCSLGYIQCGIGSPMRRTCFLQFALAMALCDCQSAYGIAQATPQRSGTIQIRVLVKQLFLI